MTQSPRCLRSPSFFLPVATENAPIRPRFPALLANCTRRHHERPRPVPAAGREDRAVALVRLADHLAHGLEPPASDLGFCSELVDRPRLFASAGVEEATVRDAQGTLKSKLKDASALFDLA